MKDIVVVRGAGDLASGIIHKLNRCGFNVLALEIENPLVVRREVAFAKAITDGEATIEGIKAIKAANVQEIYNMWDENNVPVIVDKKCNILHEINADILIDAIIAKKNLGTHRGLAPITIAIGPGFMAGKDVDAVIESHRGHNLGKVIYDGSTMPDTGIPGTIMGISGERVLRAPCEGKIKNTSNIGDSVKRGEILGYIKDTPIKAKIDGVIRGLIKNETYVSKGLKIGDVDPRDIKEYCYSISDKARTIAGGALEAILYLKSVQNN